MSASRSTTAGTCPAGHDWASDRWAVDEPPGEEEDEVLAQASADASANPPIHLMVASDHWFNGRRRMAVLTKTR